MAHATTTQLATYLSIDIGDLPSDAARLLERASELIDTYVLNNSTTDKEDTLANATCAQVEKWIDSGDELGSMGEFTTLELGDFKASKSAAGGGSGAKRSEDLAPRARQFLFMDGLFYRGVKLR